MDLRLGDNGCLGGRGGNSVLGEAEDYEKIPSRLMRVRIFAV
jgi:hypothetical protein